MEQLKKEYASIERSPVIDPELRDLLPPITDDEKAALTADILKNGTPSLSHEYLRREPADNVFTVVGPGAESG